MVRSIFRQKKWGQSSGDQDRPASRGASLAAIGAFIACLLASGPVTSASAEYEPNDSTLEAFGPLANHQTYTDKLDPENDKDFFYFYVTVPGQVTVSVKNLGGGAVLSYVGVTILDASGIALGDATNIEEGEQGSVALPLKPQKYLVEVASNLDYGAGYALETQGGEGAFGPYESIAKHCGTARSSTTTAKAGLTKAEAGLQRATARLHRTRYSTRAARRSAQTEYRKAKTRATEKRRALDAARRSQRPWCFIAP